jgi:hypothetical protein
MRGATQAAMRICPELEEALGYFTSRPLGFLVIPRSKPESWQSSIKPPKKIPLSHINPPWTSFKITLGFIYIIMYMPLPFCSSNPGSS